MRSAGIILGLVLGLSSVILAQGSAAEQDSIRVTITPLGEHIFMITSIGDFAANQVASIGPDGILLVDVGPVQTSPKLMDTLRQMGKGRIRLVVNTHSHDDHTSGNDLLRDEAIIIAQRGAGDDLKGSYYALPAIRSANHPTVVFDDSLTIRFNGEDIRLMHVPNAHTDGDIIVHFVSSGIVCLGDLIFPDMIPFVDLSLGGQPAAYIRNIDWYIDSFPATAKFVAGHGRLYSRDDLFKYRQVMTKMVDIVRREIAAGISLEEVKKVRPLAAWDSMNGPWSTTTTDYWAETLYLGLTSHPGTPLPSIAAPLSETIVSSGVDAAVEQYHRTKTEHGGDYNFGENELNNLGYQLLMRQMIAEAVKIFRLNTEAYPNSFNVFDSYAEALLMRGDTVQAIANYKKSLELNANNANATEVLRRLGVK